MSEKEKVEVDKIMEEMTDILKDEVSEEVAAKETFSQSDMIDNMRKGVTRMFNAYTWFNKLSDEESEELFKYTKEEVIENINDGSVILSPFDIIHAYENHMEMIDKLRRFVRPYKKKLSDEQIMDIIKSTHVDDED